MTRDGNTIKGPGSFLKEKRMIGKHDLANAASFLGVSVNLLSALEEDNYQSPLLKNKQLVRNYLSRYARFLELSPEDILIKQEAFLEAQRQGQISEPPHVKGVFRKVGWLMLLALIFGAAELVYWGKHKVAIRAAEAEMIQQDLAAKAQAHSIQEMIMQELQNEELEQTAQSDLEP